MIAEKSFEAALGRSMPWYIAGRTFERRHGKLKVRFDLGLSAHRLMALCERCVSEAVGASHLSGVRRLAIDERSRARGHVEVAAGKMRLRSRRNANGAAFMLLASLGVMCAAMSGCATTRSYTLPNGASAYEVTCTLWYQCTHQAAKMCPRGYRLVKGPLRPWRRLPNETHMQRPSRIDFVCL